jgi:TolB-like protein
MRIQLLLLIAIGSLLSGCATNLVQLPAFWSNTQKAEETQADESQNQEPAPAPVARTYVEDLPLAKSTTNSAQDYVVLPRRTNRYQAEYVHKDISEYAEQLTIELIQNAHDISTEARVGVASFVDFDRHLKRTTPLGNQLAESFITELQAFGVTVVDFKATGNVQVGADGDFVFSREASELASRQELQYVLSGTLRHNERGVFVNARIISLPHRRVVSASKTFIPQVVIESSVPNYSLVAR